MNESVFTYELLDWIDEETLDWSTLSSNPNAIQMLETNPCKIDWVNLSSNLNGISLLEQNIDKVDWENLSSNPNAISIL